MADAESSDESSSSIQSKGTSGSSKGNSPIRASIKSKKSSRNDGEQATPDLSSTNRTSESLKDKSMINLKSVHKKTAQQHTNSKKAKNKENRETPSQCSIEFDNRDYQTDHNSTAGGPAAKYDSDSPSRVEKSKSDKTKTNVSDKRREKTLGDNDPKNRSSNSKTKNKCNENVLNFARRNHGITDHPPKQEERANKKGTTSMSASESSESESSESDSDTSENELERGRSERKMTGEGSVSSIKEHKISSSNNHANINSSKVHSDENRSRDKEKGINTNVGGKTDELQRRNLKKTDKSKDKIDDDGYGHDLHNATQGACGSNKKKHSKKSEHNKKNSINENRKSSDGSSSCSSRGSSSSRNHDKNTSRSVRAGRGVENHGGSTSRSSSSDSSDKSGQNWVSNSQNCLRGTDKTTTDNRSKKPHDAKETSRRRDRMEMTSDRKSKKSHDKNKIHCDRSSKTNRREDSSERPPGRKSKESHDKKETGDDRSSRTSRRENQNEKPSVRKSKEFHDKKETESDRALKTSRREKRNEKPSDRKSKESHDKKETYSGHASKTSCREDQSERTSDRNSTKSYDKETEGDHASKMSRKYRGKSPSDRNSKKSHDGDEVNYKKNTTSDKSRRDRKKDNKNAMRRSNSRGSSSERRRSHSKEKSRDKERHRGKEEKERRNRDSERRHSSNSYNWERNRDRDNTDIHMKNERERYYDRCYSSHYREENRERKSSASSIDSGKYRDGSKKNERNRRKYYDDDSNEREAKYEQPNYEHEWQFENEHGNWITYGQSNTGRPLQGADVVTSDEIEKFYSKHRGTKNPMLIEANNNQYILDFIGMSQTNIKTSVRRRIRRVRKSDEHTYQSQKYNEDYHYGDARDYNLASSNFGRSSGQPPDPKDNQTTRKNDSSAKFEWQFEDESGNWITYGKINSAKDRNTGSSTTSDDIEKFRSRDPSKGTMQIRSGRDQYLLNFKQMTEVNIETLGCRRVRRVAKSSWGIQNLVQWLGWSRPSLSRSRDVDMYEWQFQDERGVWITYGQASSNGITAFSTAASSDDIESYYSSTPDKAPIIISSRTHTYVLDFSKMVQINQETLVQRPIQRVKKTSNGSKTNHQGGVGQNYVTAGNGTNAGVNNFYNPSHNPANFGYGAGNVSQSFNPSDPRGNVGVGQHLNSPSSPCVWQFQDENGSWITYGRPSSTNQTAGSTTTSDDIEQYFSTNPGKTSMNIQSPSNQYVLNFQKMIQINQKTQAQKPVRRVMKQHIQLTPNFQQGF